ncbi:hypothetical protein IWQ60_008938 [Tieghemiomyces parasiticus]|uniref:Uncharacterized protein n=1 Tax=Tieghemiomyces parasiticus TaxID=78921 RepID=A0A9W8DM19_9FUNG|nr:hypothetical protein IWQ60_008938 [Tieghemiomyces parasiticus]
MRLLGIFFIFSLALGAIQAYPSDEGMSDLELPSPLITLHSKPDTPFYSNQKPMSTNRVRRRRLGQHRKRTKAPESRPTSDGDTDIESDDEKAKPCLQIVQGVCCMYGIYNFCHYLASHL